MFTGHFGLAAGVRAKAPEVPLWALMVGTQLLDIAFVPLLLTGAETMDQSHGTGYGEAIIHADYTHSLLGALILAFIAGWLGRRQWGRRAGVILGAVVFSHWVLDLLVHRADLPLLPGNWGNLPLLGLGIWKYEWLSAGLELLLLVVGFAMYVRSIPRTSQGKSRNAAYLSAAVLGVLLILFLITDVAGLF
ncbi:metal-dependent hydrolase [Cohnella terricola]|uniref:Permease n=1 Tax=Cohnella terricola TaxID=1289167 RepID=A0A559JGY6_9BACL|nr:metal-dependent hydrolase [Cohnella terricola]TVX99137.1 permease [Cohnella terricola]